MIARLLSSPSDRAGGVKLILFINYLLFILLNIMSSIQKISNIIALYMFYDK